MNTTSSVRLDLREGSDPPVSKKAFAEVMSHMAATVCVVSAGDGEQRLGRTATAVLSLSAEPPTVLVSIKSDSALAKAIAMSGGFSLAMLSEGQELIGDAFAGHVPPATRHLFGVWGAWASGRPHLIGAAAAMDCTLAGTVTAADHDLFIGSIIATDVSGHSRPLLWSGREYRSLKGKPGQTPQQKSPERGNVLSVSKRRASG